MPDPKDNAKASGDVHPPLEDQAGGNPRAGADTEGAPGTGRQSPLASEREDEGRPGKGENQAGFLKDQDAPGGGQGDGKA